MAATARSASAGPTPSCASRRAFAARQWLAERFEAERPRLRGMAYRMLGSATEAGAVAAGTLAFVGRAQAARIALVDGAPGFVVAPLGRLRLAVKLSIADCLITDIQVIAAPE